MVPGSKVTCMAQNPYQRSRFVVGFKDTLLQLWDINDQKKPVWQARNLPNDELDL